MISKNFLPSNTNVLGIERNLGPNSGNGDYCLYLVRQKMATALSRDEILSFYEDAVIPGINEGGFVNNIEVIFPDNQTHDDKLIYFIEVEDMTERYFDFGCRQVKE